MPQISVTLTDEARETVVTALDYFLMTQLDYFDYANDEGSNEWDERGNPRDAYVRQIALLRGLIEVFGGATTPASQMTKGENCDD